MLTKNTNNFSNSSNDPLNLYLNKNYAALANSNLTKKLILMEILLFIKWQKI